VVFDLDFMELMDPTDPLCEVVSGVVPDCPFTVRFRLSKRRHWRCPLAPENINFGALVHSLFCQVTSDHECGADPRWWFDIRHSLGIRNLGTVSCFRTKLGKYGHPWFSSSFAEIVIGFQRFPSVQRANLAIGRSKLCREHSSEHGSRDFKHS
jgi:hypothetical protein